MKKIIVIGLDGATWDIIMPLVKKKKLPSIEKLLKGGVYGSLISTIPPVTGPSWLSFATGKNPGKTGVYDFLTLIGERARALRLSLVSSKFYQGQSVWDYLSRNDLYKVGVAFYPTLYPPYPINGFMISGAHSPIDNITYPEDLKKEIEEVSGKIESTVHPTKKKYDDLELFLKDINRFTCREFKAVLHLLKTKSWNLFIYVCSSVDWVQHRMWKYIDDTHPQHDQNMSLKYIEGFENYFQEIDGFLGQLLAFKANLILVSDHGFGAHDQCFNLARWLRDKGYMLEIGNKSKLSKSIRTMLLGTLRMFFRGLKLRRYIPKNMVHSLRRTLSTEFIELIDVNKSRAYCMGHDNIFGGIYINQNLVNSREMYKLTKEQIINDLQSLTEEIKKPLQVTIFDPEKIYDGDKISLAPDIIFTINDWRCAIIENNFHRPLFEENPSSEKFTGTHRVNGIFLAYGSDIKKGMVIDDLKIYDVAPSILHIFDIPIPENMDGRVIKEIFKKGSDLATRSVKYLSTESEKDRIREKIFRMKGPKYHFY